MDGGGLSMKRPFTSSIFSTPTDFDQCMAMMTFKLTNHTVHAAGHLESKSKRLNKQRLHYGDEFYKHIVFNK